MELKYVTAFTVGFTILFLEIIASRIISPIYGNTVFVWSAIIGITIISLAVGYYIGGRRSKKENIAIPLVLGASFIPILNFMNIPLMFTTYFGVQVGSIIASGLVLAYPLTMFGMVSPMLIQKLKDEKGMASGKIFSIGTVGSFFGAILTGFILIPNFSITNLMITVPLATIAIALIWSKGEKQITVTSVVPYGLVFLALTIIPVQTADGLLYEKESLYSNLKVIETDTNRQLWVDGSLQSITKHNGESLLGFTQYSTSPLFYNDVTEILVLGLGSGGIDYEYEMIGAKVNIDTIEIDPEIVKISKEYFGYDGNAIVGDARNYLITTDKKYDAVIYDLSKGDSYPTHLFTSDAFKQVKNVLNDGGILIVHQSGSIDSEMIKAYYSTISSVFEHTNLINFENSPNPANQMKLFVASNQELVLDPVKVKSYYPYTEGDNFIRNLQNSVMPDDGLIVTDDYNPLDIWQLEYTEEWRESYWEMVK